MTRNEIKEQFMNESDPYSEENITHAYSLTLREMKDKMDIHPQSSIVDKKAYSRRELKILFRKYYIMAKTKFLSVLYFVVQVFYILLFKRSLYRLTFKS